MKITFKLEHPKRNRSAVSARVYHEKQRYKFATGISVPTALWSGNAGGLKTGVQVTAKHGMTPLTAQNVNDSLARIERKFALSWSDELKSDEFNVSRIIRRLKGENPDPRKSTQTVVEVIEDYMDFAKSNPIGRNGSPIRSSTLKQYRTAVRRMQELGVRRGSPVLACEVDQGHWAEYYQMEVNELKKKASYASAVWTRVQTALRWAHGNGVAIHDDIVFNRIKRIRPKSYRRAVVSLEELDQLRSLDLSGPLERTRDLFIIGNWTALRVSDLMKLELVGVQNRGGRAMIQVDTQKTGELIDIPLHPHVIAIRDRWEGWPKKMNAQDYNANLKKLGKLAGWTQREYGEKVSLVEVNGELVRREKSGHYPKYELLTSHLSRRSFATNMYSLGMMSSNDIRKMTGHKTERLLEAYIHSNPKDVTNRIDDVFQSLS